MRGAGGCAALLGVGALMFAAACMGESEGCFVHDPSSSPGTARTASAQVTVRVENHALAGYVDVDGGYYNLRDPDPSDSRIRPVLPVADGSYTVSIRVHPSATPGP